MTHTSRTMQAVTAAAIAGGAAWLAKFAVIVATDGATDDEGAAAFFYLLGVALMAVGAASVTLRLARGRLTTVLAALAAPFAFFASFMLLEAIAKALVGDTGPVWLGDEIGIAVTGAAWFVAGAVMLSSSRGASPLAGVVSDS